MNSNRMVFLNIGWMKYYQGILPDINDTIEYGGEFVTTRKWGHEIYNYKPLDGYMYGFVEPVINKNGEMSQIALERIDPDSIDTEYIKDVLAIWTANNPYRAGTNIVGWYKNAIVYREAQDDIERYYKNHKIPYFVKAIEKDCTLIPASKRIKIVPRGRRDGAGWMGRSNIWYADSDNPNIKGYKEEVVKYIKEYESKRY